MSDFLLQFINLKYSTITLQMEFSYNLVDGIDRFKVGVQKKYFENILSKSYGSSLSLTLPCSGTSSHTISPRLSSTGSSTRSSGSSPTSSWPLRRSIASALPSRTG